MCQTQAALRWLTECCSLQSSRTRRRLCPALMSSVWACCFSASRAGAARNPSVWPSPTPRRPVSESALHFCLGTVCVWWNVALLHFEFCVFRVCVSIHFSGRSSLWWRCVFHPWLITFTPITENRTLDSLASGHISFWLSFRFLVSCCKRKRVGVGLSKCVFKWKCA